MQIQKEVFIVLQILVDVRCPEWGRKIMSVLIIYKFTDDIFKLHLSLTFIISITIIKFCNPCNSKPLTFSTTPWHF